MRFRLEDIQIEHPSPPYYAYIPYLSHMHAIGASEGRTVYEIKRVNPEDQEGNQESVVQPTEPREPEKVVEYPCHEPARFVKGKPRSIISLLPILPSLSNILISIVALSIGLGMKPLLHYILPCPDTLPYPGIELGSSSS